MLICLYVFVCSCTYMCACIYVSVHTLTHIHNLNIYKCTDTDILVFSSCAMPNQTRTRYTNRRTQSRSTNAMVMPESEYRHQLTLLVREQKGPAASMSLSHLAGGGTVQKALSTLADMSWARSQVAVSNLLHRSRSAQARVSPNKPTIGNCDRLPECTGVPQCS